MSIYSRLTLIALCLTGTSLPMAAQPASAPGFTGAGTAAETFVLVTGMVGGVAGFHRLERLLLARGYRVIVVDPYRLSLDSADVTFAAMARRVDVVLARQGVTAARVVAHSHGAGVALRLAAASPGRVSALFLLDAGAQAANRGPTLSASLRLVPFITRMPGGREFVRSRFIRKLRENTGHQEWLDAATERAYTEPMLDGISQVVAMACRLARADEPESLSAVLSRVHAPITVLIGDAPHETGAGPEELAALEPLGALVHIEHLAGVGHFPHEEVPNELARLLVESRGTALDGWSRRAAQQ